MRKSVEAAFTLIHVSETGADVGSVVPTTISSPVANVGAGRLVQLKDWYRSLEKSGKQGPVGDIIAGVLSKAAPGLSDFISSQNDRSAFDAVTRVYNMMRGVGSGTRNSLTQQYGEPFVVSVEAHAPELSILQRPGSNIHDFNLEQNALFASITVRVYRAITAPAQGEDRSSMVRLFGETFVRAVEANLAGLAPLNQPAAGEAEMMKVPQQVRDAIFVAYPVAHGKSVAGIMRGFRRQDENLFFSLGAIYAVLRDAPAQTARKADKEAFQTRLGELKVAYGEALVVIVAANFKEFGFLESPSAKPEDMSSLRPEFLEALNVAFERGPAVKRANFMANYMHVADKIPMVYGQLSAVLLFANPTATLGQDLSNAVALYRAEFGSNDYLFNMYFNLPLLSANIARMTKAFHLRSDLPPQLRGGISSPEDMVLLLSSPFGMDLVTAGRSTFNKIMNDTQNLRAANNYHPTTGDYSDNALASLSNNLSIFDALYLGIALSDISGSHSVVGSQSAVSIMNSLLVLQARDPYLIGPFLLQVLPAMINASQDERTLVTALEAFNGIVTNRYQSGARDMAYSTSLSRSYFLKVFETIGKKLPEIVSTFDHNAIEDELRLVPEPRTDENYMSPLLYRYRPNFLQQPTTVIPNLYGQEALPLTLVPTPLMPGTPALPVPGGFTLDTGARGLFSGMYDFIRPPAARLFRQRVPAQYRIGALGASTIIRRLTECFGPMPTDYSDFLLSVFAETGGFYSYQQAGQTETTTGGAAGAAVARTTTGAAASTVAYTKQEDKTTSTDNTGTTVTDTNQNKIDAWATASHLPYPMAGVVPLALKPDEELGLHRGQAEFHRETGESTTTVTPPGGPTTVTDATPSVNTTSGLLDTYSRIAKDNKTDMLLYVAGNYAPELKGSTPAGGGDQPVTQPEYGHLKSRLYFITQEGNVYQLALGLDTQDQLQNYLYAGANTQQYLAGIRALGKGMLTGDSAAHGFDGAAFGFTLPKGGADTYSSLAFGELVRDMTAMQPVFVTNAVGNAVTNMLADKKQRDIYAAFYRGDQNVTVDPRDSNHITGTSWAQGSGEIMWRRMRIDPMAYQAEVRAIAGWPLTAGVRARLEWKPSRAVTNAVGITAGVTDIDLLHEFKAINSDTDQIYARTHNVLVSLYNWSEDEARDTGYLISGSYTYSRLENFITRNPDGTYTTTPTAPGETRPNPNYASALMMYWAQRHGILLGAERVPAFSMAGGMYSKIDAAMTAIQQDPTNEKATLQGLSDSLRQDMQRDVWRFAIGYGYDGERLRIYTVGGAQFTGDASSYGNLYGLFLFGRPTKFFADILGHAYTYSPLVISQTQTGQFAVNRSDTVPYLDLYSGVGYSDWVSWNLSRYEREVSLSAKPDNAMALRDVYREIGSPTPNWNRIRRIYGSDFVDTVSENRESFKWMLRPSAEVETDIKARVRDDDPVAMQAVNLRKTGTADALLDVYSELRKAEPDLVRLRRQYTSDFVDLVANNMADLDWLLLPDTRMRSEFNRRAGKTGSAEAAVAEVKLPPSINVERLNGEETKRIFEENLLDVIVAATDRPSRYGVRPESYDVLLGSDLAGNKEMRRDHYYILYTPVASRSDAKGSLVIGDDADLDEWRLKGHEIGRGIVRVEISHGAEGKYKFTFSGDKKIRSLSAAKVMGGVSLPLTGAGYDNYRMSGNWTIGGVVSLLQSHKQDLLGGALYGVRQFGNEQWSQWTITLSHRLQTLSTATMNDQLFSYVFFNRLTKKIVFASNQVFMNQAEMQSVCQQLGGCTDMNELTRTTIGSGVTWAKADMIAGSR